MNKKKAIILLSGGLDSLVSLALAQKDYDIALALTFDYGQKSAEREICASQKICEYYCVPHKIMKLDWLKDLIKGDKRIWVPNRNALFLNIAAAFADANAALYKAIIIGANAQEAIDFPDNTKDFIEKINKVFELSTETHPQVVAPLIDLNKQETVKVALAEKVPLQLAYSCYEGGEKNCGNCPSCKLLKEALLSNCDNYFINLLF